LIGYTDAGYLSDSQNVISQTGLMFLHGRTATLIAMSMNYSDIIALYEASRECVWLRRVVNHI
jgi:hypothetical protein